MIFPEMAFRILQTLGAADRSIDFTVRWDSCLVAMPANSLAMSASGNKRSEDGAEAGRPAPGFLL